MPTSDRFSERYADLARYNAWANERIYTAAAHLTESDYQADRGVFFGSVHRTLNHLLVTDHIWMKRMTGTGAAPDRLDAILFDTLPELAAARKAEDARIIDYIDTLTTDDLLADFTYANMAGARFRQMRAGTLDHLFNHQTHHRGQVHGLISRMLGNECAPVLDLLAFQRENSRGGVRCL